VTDINDANEPFTTSINSFVIQGMNTFFGNFIAEISPITDLGQQSEVITYTQIAALPSMQSIIDEAQIWSLYFDGSKSKEGVGVGYVLIDHVGNKKFISCKLEFECTNNTVDYEALLQVLRKSLDMDVQNLMVFGDS
jgi:hypothetical protein